ncbi:TIGR02281 family clan AA aspartic protease [Peteryoungia desertarenae]|uniref:TIGR02281 family clan AA aspartic protease n=1 Tax=Peteryoungia desertarenae TaxID=1813451 RepID=A0ABX6QT95_9HYPH|nr:TIGR02281 family clan AA aspartic protease [Peteryoungia desertarenae]QLF71432.1 TIGR02281 family clan AA aspartic protease [Peteryoungia desertarenae]
MMGFWIVIGILGFGLAVLILNHDAGQSFGLANDDFSKLIILLPIMLMLSSGVLLGRRSFGQTFRQISAWILIALALMTGYLYRTELNSVGERLMAGLIPGRAVVVDTGEERAEVILHKTFGGHFETEVEVGPVPVSVLIDTGASAIALRYEDAVRIGIDPASLNYNRTILTANGRAMAAGIRLGHVQLGPIIRRNVDAVVLEQGRLEQSLLGMSFLSTLDSLEIRSDELRLRD